MKVLITGGAGFIGTAVARAALRRGMEVRLFDIAPCTLDGVDAVRGSILDRHAIGEAAEGCHAVVHLAAMLGVRKTDLRRLECLNINIEGAVNVFEAAIRAGVKRVVFASSSEVYGEPAEMPIGEDAPFNPKSVYGVTKIAAEEYLRAYGLRHDLDHRIVRFFNVYGVGQVAEFVLPRFVKAVLNGHAPTIYGTGEQIRCFCYVDDAAEGICLALLNGEANGMALNIGNDEEPISIKDLAKKVLEIADMSRELKYIELAKSGRQDGREIYNRIPDITRARSVLGFQPRVSLDQGIRKLLAQDHIQDTFFEPKTY